LGQLLWGGGDRNAGTIYLRAFFVEANTTSDLVVFRDCRNEFVQSLPSRCGRILEWTSLFKKNVMRLRPSDNFRRLRKVHNLAFLPLRMSLYLGRVIAKKQNLISDEPG